MNVEEYEATLKSCLKAKGYILQKNLGRGGFAACYMVYLKRLCYQFACKVIIEADITSAENTRQVVDSYYDEIEILKLLNHPNIIKIYDYFESSPFKIIIIELCPNGDLDHKVPESGFSESDLINYSGQLIDAVKYLHSRNITHHDIKPANCLIDRYGRLKLSDFGLAHRYQTHASALKRGTLAYTAPEVLDHRKYDPFKADVWSLGATLYKFAYGKPSVSGFGDIGEIKKLLPFVASKVSFDRIKPELAIIISRCLRYEPTFRPTIDQIAIEFARIKRPVNRIRITFSANCMMKQPSIIRQIVSQKRAIANKKNKPC